MVRCGLLFLGCTSHISSDCRKNILSPVSGEESQIIWMIVGEGWTWRGQQSIVFSLVLKKASFRPNQSLQPLASGCEDTIGRMSSFCFSSLQPNWGKSLLHCGSVSGTKQHYNWAIQWTSDPLFKCLFYWSIQSLSATHCHQVFLRKPYKLPLQVS